MKDIAPKQILALLVTQLRKTQRQIGLHNGTAPLGQKASEKSKAMGEPHQNHVWQLGHQPPHPHQY
ncbi:hypothetical protein GCM10025791_09930 [Halioxenophilus aromaticivorans]|uniref:Uncharacterized protein n=1 Tax=Halioxenophilus aromaticivorans TaxID=1306992 RepID=A0AAV3TZC8_9ALTE